MVVLTIVEMGLRVDSPYYDIVRPLCERYGAVIEEVDDITAMPAFPRVKLHIKWQHDNRADSQALPALDRDLTLRGPDIGSLVDQVARMIEADRVDLEDDIQA
jgi:hypothetical protein